MFRILTVALLAACAVEVELDPVQLSTDAPAAEVQAEPRTLWRSETCRICPLSPRMIPRDGGGWLQPRRVNEPDGGCRWVDDWIPLDEQEPCPNELDTGL